jgi:hypothetical protein
MKHMFIAAAFAAGLGVTFTALPGAGDPAGSQAFAQTTTQNTKTKSDAKGRPVELRRGGYYGYYSYGNSDAGRKTHRDIDPWGLYDLQSQGGPFDSGFWFDSGVGPRWNNTPYPR